MPVGKGESSSAVVIRCGSILPVVGVGIRDKEGIIDRIRMLIQSQISHAGLDDVRGLDELTVAPTESPTFTAHGVVILVIVRSTKERIHGVASQSLLETSLFLCLAQEVIGWAFIDANSTIGVLPQHPIPDPKAIGHTAVTHRAACSPRHDVVHPVIEHSRSNGLLSTRNGEIIGTAILIVY